MRVYNTTSEAYLASLEEVFFNPDTVSSPRGQPVREKFNYMFCVLNPSSEPIVTRDEDRNKTIAAYTQKEKELYDSCSNRAEDFGKASKFWLDLANPDGTVNSAYGFLIWKNKSHGSHFEKKLVCVSEPEFDGDGTIWRLETVKRTPWEWCVETLKRDKDSRQAVLRFSLPEHFWVGNKDQTCTMHGVFTIREDKLHFSINMRSNDLTLGLVYDLPWFCSLMDKMIDELRDTYPSLSKGHYTHFVHNIHLYERDRDKILKMLGKL